MSQKELIKNLNEILNQKDTVLIPENIKSGINILGIEGSSQVVDTLDATASSNDLLINKTAYVNGQKVTGTIVDNDYLYYTPSTSDQEIPKGYTDGGTVWGDSNLVASNIKKGTSIFNVTGTFTGLVDTTDATAVASQILEGETAYVSDIKITGTMKNLGTQTITPKATEQSISNGYIEKLTVSGDSNLVPENIKEGVTIFNIEGTMDPGLDTSDATATINDIKSGQTAYVNGELITGTVPFYGQFIFTDGSIYKVPSSSVIRFYKTFNTGPVGFNYGGACIVEFPYSTVASSIGLTADKILSGNTILGIDGTAGLDTSDATAVASDILLNKTAYVNGELITGTHECLDTTDANADASNILIGKTAYVNDVKITGTMPNHGAITLTPEGSTTTTTTLKGYVQSVSVPSINECLSEPIPTTIEGSSIYSNATSQTTFTLSTQRGFRVMAFISCFNIPIITTSGWELVDTQAIHHEDGGKVLKTLFVYTKIAEADNETISIDSTRSDLQCIMTSFNSSYEPELVYSYLSNGELLSRAYIDAEIKPNDIILTCDYDSAYTYLSGVENTLSCDAYALRLFTSTANVQSGEGYVYTSSSSSSYFGIYVFRFPEITPLDSDNIRSGITVGGVQGTYTVDGTALASEIVQDKVAYVNGQKLLGTMYSYGDIEIEANDIDQPMSSGFIDSATIKKVDITSLYDYKNCYDIANKILDSTYEITPHRQIDYMDFTGSQYLNLQYPLWNYSNWSIEFKVNFDYWYSYQHLLSIADDDIIHETWVDGSGAWLIRMASGNKQTIANLTPGVDYVMKIEWDSGICKCYLDGELKNTTSFGSFTSTYNVRFGQRNGAHFIGRFYYLKFWTSDELQGDLLPVIRVEDDYPCAYDSVRDLYIINAEGSTLFENGPLTKEVEDEI